MLIEIQGNVLVCAHVTHISRVMVFQPPFEPNHRDYQWSPVNKDWLVAKDPWLKQAYARFDIGLTGVPHTQGCQEILEAKSLMKVVFTSQE